MKCVVLLFRIDSKSKSTYSYPVTNKREELVLCKRIQPSSIASSLLWFMKLKSFVSRKLRRAFKWYYIMF